MLIIRNYLETINERPEPFLIKNRIENVYYFLLGMETEIYRQNTNPIETFHYQFTNWSNQFFRITNAENETYFWFEHFLRRSKPWEELFDIVELFFNDKEINKESYNASLYIKVKQRVLDNSFNIINLIYKIEKHNELFLTTKNIEYINQMLIGKIGLFDYSNIKHPKEDLNFRSEFGSFLIDHLKEKEFNLNETERIPYIWSEVLENCYGSASFERFFEITKEFYNIYGK